MAPAGSPVAVAVSWEPSESGSVAVIVTGAIGSLYSTFTPPAGASFVTVGVAWIVKSTFETSK